MRMWLWWRPLPPATFTHNPSNSREETLPPPPFLLLLLFFSSSPPPPPSISTTAPLPCSRILLYKPGTDVCRGRAERPRCSGCQPHAFHSEMKAHSSPSCEANFQKKKREKKEKRKRGGKKQTLQMPSCAFKSNTYMRDRTVSFLCVCVRAATTYNSWRAQRQTSLFHPALSACARQRKGGEVMRRCRREF